MLHWRQIFRKIERKKPGLPGERKGCSPLRSSPQYKPMAKACEIKHYMDAIRKCRLFSGLPEGSYEETLRFLDARVRSFQKSEIILNIGDPFRYAVFMLEGTLDVSFISESLDQISMNQFHAFSLIGESFALIKGFRSPMQLTAVTDCTILFLDLQPLVAQPVQSCTAKERLTANLLITLSGQNIFLSQKVRIFGQKALRDRIRVYLRSMPVNAEGFITVPFSKTTLAEYLGVNRSALSRELSHLEEEGMLELDGRRIRVLSEDFY